MGIKDTIEVPTYWAMFTAGGNKMIEDLARQLLDDLDAVHRHEFGADFYVEGKGPRSAEKRAYHKFFEAWRDLDGESIREASDTAVREEVWAFAVRASSYTQYVDEGELDAVWTGDLGTASEGFGMVKGLDV